ncbi:MAG: rhomboid family intramembrane serine protease [Anaerolineales bacterium]|nr:rhomboid family intramembrane serine protease [Anaerolineales bacterium]MDP3183918.1 rhomboid family intramembrane serine protease [Anaerolineales bacterium]
MSQYPTPEPYSQPPQPQVVRVNMPHVKPYATYTLIGLTVFIYLLQLLGQQFDFDIVTSLGIKYSYFILKGQIWRLVTPVFLHGSILHIGFNMYALFNFGQGIEARFGHLRFLALYFLSGFAGNVLSFVLTPAASLGASTAVFGLLAAEGIFLFQNRELLREQFRRVITSILYMAAINLLFGFTTSGIDNWGHIGGLLGGVLFTWFGGPRWKVEGIFPSLHVVDERDGHGLLAGTTAVLLFFIPLAALGWIWPVGK